MGWSNVSGPSWRLIGFGAALLRDGKTGMVCCKGFCEGERGEIGMINDA